MSNPNQIDREDKVSRFSVGPGVVVVVALVLILLAALVTYLLVAH